MADKPTYEELEQRNKEFEQETERFKLVEDALEKSAVIISTTTDAVITTDVDGKITFWNKGAERIYGYQEREVLGKPISIIYKDEDLPVLISMIADLLDGKDIPSIEVTCIDNEGKEVHILLSLTSIKNNDGNITELIGITKDITERKQAEEALRESEEFSTRLLEHSPNPILVFNTDTSIRYVNKAFEKLTGYTSKEVLGKHPPFPWWIDDPRSANADEQKHFLLKGVNSLERLLRKKNEELFWVEVAATSIRANKGLHYALATWTDITERKQVEEALQKIHDELEKQVEERTSELSTKTKSLVEMNTALRILIEQRGSDKIEIEEKVLGNVKELVEPYLEKLKATKLNDSQQSFVDVLESNLNDIVSPFVGRLSGSTYGFSRMEIRVATLIKTGINSKEIAEILNLSVRTIESHRDSIRRKLGVKNKKVNLVTHLLTIR